nr:glycoside hydrolase family 5 protein [Lachnospiraceae bacterium]
MDQKKLEKGIFIICGGLGVIFLTVLAGFLARTGKRADQSVDMTGQPGVTESGENMASAGNSAQEGTAQSMKEEDGQDTGATNQTGGGDVSGQDTTEGTPVVFTSNASQSTEGDWLFVEGNQIVDASGKPVWLTGINWFGYNTGTNCFDGLWTCDLNSSIKAIADHGFNILRIPISTQLLLQWKNGEYPTANFNQATNDYLVGMNSLEIFDYVLDLCEQNGIKVLLDTHCAMTNASGHTVNLWVDGEIDEADFIEAWVWVADRYKDNDTIIAFDLKNEPHGKPFEQNKAIWNDSTDPNNWKYVAEKTAAQIFAVNPNVLI